MIGIKNFRAFELKYLGATDTKGARIRIRDLRFKKSVILDRDYEVNPDEQAIYYLQGLGIHVTGMAEGNEVSYVFTDDFDIELRRKK